MSPNQDSPAKSWRPLLVIAAASLVAGFAAGFILADRLNRQEHDRLRAEAARLREAAVAARRAADGSGAEGGRPSERAGAEGELDIPTLTEDQLRAAVERADASPADSELQRVSGQALYLYAIEKGDAALLPDAARILERASRLDPRDARLAVFAGNAHFQLARQAGEAGPLRRARSLYERALASDPRDTDARTSLGLTYFFDTPPDPQRAAAEYRRALDVDPRAEAPLQGLVAALAAAGRLEEAERRLGELAAVNPNNPELQNLRAQLEQKRNAAKETP
ncbi:MAG TPA: tetratricopeptide repeat protein [Pyrinomonadaceae bacterium]|nr:tetratricopeptide repeat protein [Pyrinomonadaceae bacterium]